MTPIQELFADTTTPETAAIKITQPIVDSYIAGEEPESGLWDLWASINNAARSTPSDDENQDKLVDLVAAIKSLPPLVRPGSDEQCHVWGSKVWESLPIFGANMREDWNWFDRPAEDPNRARARTEWRNLNAFAARLTVAGTYDFALYAIWGLRGALEDKPQAPDPQADPQGQGRSTSSILDALVPAAAEWIFHAGRLIYNNTTEFEHGPSRGDPARGGDLWDGKRGFCHERWALWKSRFQWAARQEAAEDSKKVAKSAVEVMDLIESE